MQYYEIQLQISNVMQLQAYIYIYNDRYIMKDVMQTYSSMLIYKRLNTCRLFLRVAFLSEISDYSGTKLDKTL